MKNDFVLIGLARKYNFKKSNLGVFGEVNGQPLYLEMGQGYVNFTITFTLADSTISYVNKELFDKYIEEKRTSKFVSFGNFEIDRNKLMISNINGCTSKEKTIERLDSIIKWWTLKLASIGNFNLEDSSQVFLYNNVPGPSSPEYRSEFENKIKKELKERPVNNLRGFINGGLLSLLLSIIVGFSFSFIRHKTSYGIPPYIDISLVLFILAKLYSRYSNGFNKKSFLYIITLFLSCTILSQISNILFYVWFQKGLIDLDQALFIFLQQFKSNNTYSVILLLVTLQFVVSLLFLKKVDEKLKVEEGELITKNDEKKAFLDGHVLAFLGRYFLITMITTLASIFVTTMIGGLELSYISYYRVILLYLALYIVCSIAMIKLFEKGTKNTFFSRPSYYRKADFITYILSSFLLTLFMALAICISILGFNHYFDPWSKSTVKGVLIEGPSPEKKSCSQLDVLIESSGKVAVEFCSGSARLPKKGEEVEFVKGKGLFFIEYYKKLN